MRKLFKTTLLSSVIIFTLATIANAQSLLPSFLRDLLDDWNNSTATDKLVGFVRLALTLAFGIVILAAVAFSIMAAIKYIRSQGDAGQVEEANKAIKAIFQGVIAMFIGIIGVVLVFFIFDVALPDPSLPPVCVKCPESYDCRVCSEGKIESGDFYTYNNTQTNITEANCKNSPTRSEDCPK